MVVEHTEEKSDSRIEYPNAYLVIPLGIFGALFGMAVVLIYPGEHEAAVNFTQRPEFLVWLFLIIVQTTLFAIFPFFLIIAVKKLKQYTSENMAKIILSGIGFLVFLTFPRIILGTGVSFTFPLKYHVLRFWILTITGLLTTGLPACIGIFLVYSAAKESSKLTIANKEAVNNYLFFYKQLHVFLYILGLVISLATIATGASRRTLIASVISPEQFPVELVLVYGGYYTFVLAIIYIPVYQTLKGFGRQLVDRFYPLLEPNSSDWDEKYEKRKKLEELLRFKMSVRQSFETSIAIFTPLISGFISFLVK